MIAAGRRFTLKIGSVYLAPRASVWLEEPPDFLQLVGNDQACGCSTLSGNRTFTFKVCFQGGGSLASAWALFNQLSSQLDLACDQEILLQRRVQDEDTLVYRVTKGTIRIVDPATQYTCERVLCAEVSLTLTPSVINQRSLNPILMTITFPPPTITVDTSITPSPIVTVISFSAPVMLIDIVDIEPIVLTVGFPTFVRDLGGVDVAAGSASFVYLPALKKLWTGQIDLDTDDIRVLLVMTSTNADTNDEAEFVGDFTVLDEFNGVGYTAGGAALTGEAVNQDTPNARAEFDADNLAFGALANGTRQITGLVMYKFVTNYADSPVIAYMNFTNFNPAGGALTLEWSAEGIMWHT